MSRPHRRSTSRINVPNPRVFIFANPIAGRGEGSGIARRLHARLGADGYDVHVVFERPDEFDVARLGGPDPVAAAVVIGGDGTLRAVAHRLFLDRDEGGGADAPVDPPPLLVVPLGTANLMG